MDTLTELRKEIDNLDKEIVKLINERAEFSLSVRNIKKNEGMPVLDEERESQIISKLAQINAGPLSNTDLTEIYTIILIKMKEFDAKL